MAKAVVDVAKEKNNFKFLYPLDMPIKDKIRTIATKVYGAKDVEYEPIAEEKIAKFSQLGYDTLPICMAKSHLSLSHDPNLKGRPEGFILSVRDIRASVGAGFLYPLCGKMQTMPGLPSKPALLRMDIDKKGKHCRIIVRNQKPVTSYQRESLKTYLRRFGGEKACSRRGRRRP